MKKDSDNYRSSSVIDIIESLKKYTKNILIFEPTLNKLKSFNDCKVINDLNKFKDISDIIITNRITSDLDDVKFKVFTRDIFQEN